MKRIVAGVVLLLLGAVAGVAQTKPANGLQEAMRQRVELLAADDVPMALGERVLSWELVKEFYVQREHRPAWIESGALAPRGLELMREVSLSGTDGLLPQTYHFEVYRDLFREGVVGGTTLQPLSRDQLTGIDILLTDSFFMLANHYRGGRIDPVSIDPDWEATRSEMDLIRQLNAALQSGEVVETLRLLLPQQPGYQRLKAALATHRALSRTGGWPLVDAGPTLKPGETGPRVAQLRARLAVTDTLVVMPDSLAEVYDADLEAAVKRFQRRHGLASDGVVGSGTLAQLNVPVEQRVDQLLASLERWRWFPEQMGERHIYVNIANFELDIIERGSQVWTTRVIVGKHYRKTPVFSGMVSYMVVHPTWTVPPTILKNDVIPAVRKDIGYLAEKKMTLYKSTPGGLQAVDPATVNWSGSSIPYSVVQSPGPHNALGQIKFMFPNKWNVYMHDTPSRELFAKDERTFSSGCIRVEHPVTFAEKLIEADNAANLPVLQTSLKGTETKTVRLNKSVPVHILYLTAWVNPDGTVNFRKDIYGRDGRLLAALKAFAPLDGDEEADWEG